MVEHQEAEDGSWWYDLYSDGWLVQRVKAVSVGRDTSINFPKEFRDTNYTPLNSQYWGSTNPFSDNFFMQEFTTTSLSCFTGNNLSSNSVYLIVQGYAA